MSPPRNKSKLKRMVAAGVAAGAAATIGAGAVVDANQGKVSSVTIPPLREYQLPVYEDTETPVQILHWSRQIGKSEVLARWAVKRLLTRPGRLVVVLSNSKDNGKEFATKSAEVARALGRICEEEEGLDPNDIVEGWSFEIRIKVKGRVGRIKVLAANPRTARGFSGDLILDEFAFHADDAAIWDAAEPILASNPDFLCRIASTGNGKGNMFYRMVTGGTYPVVRVRRSDAWRMGVKIRSLKTGQEITPEQAREEALDKESYDQNYECKFAEAQGALLTVELIDAAERPDCGEICDGEWSTAAMVRLRRLREGGGRLAIGYDVARRRHYSVFAVVERLGAEYFARAFLRMRDMRFADQRALLDQAMSLIGRYALIGIDQTGLGEAQTEIIADKYGAAVRPFQFGSSLPVSRELQGVGQKGKTAPLPLVVGSRLLRLHMDGQMRYPVDPLLRDDLRKPERVTTDNGRVTIAAPDDANGHADHFWALGMGGYLLSEDDGHLFLPKSFDRNTVGGRHSRTLRAARRRLRRAAA